ncbi:pupal cuticle protein 20-like [Anoplophora glabripennis]|uniref:pupal cuticle protein 20-like n=1 Tax=Anoplophora glabripennis TaxID=217634 RepID=UPI0008751681|nr:pupal cuticle protein 20-like [Anoplophora glabripennis]
MKVLLCVILIFTLVSAEKLQSNYLPPITAQSAAGSSSFLSAPRPFSGFSASSGSAFTQSGIATSYAAPPSGPVPSGVYNAPIGHYSTGVPIAILRFNNENTGDGSYRFDYQTENKISQAEQGHLQNAGTDQASSVVHGTYSYEAPNGQTITVTYVADENGFRASGDHIPTPPPIPAAIQKSLQFSSSDLSTAGYSSSSSFSGGVSSTFGTTPQHPQIARQYLGPSTKSTGGYRY